MSDLDGVSSIPLPPLYTLDGLPVSKEEIPRQRDADEWPHLKGISLPEAGQDVEVGLLIGYNCPKALEPLEAVRSEDEGPYAVRTIFGWTMAGPRKGSTPGYEKQHRARVHRIKTDKKPDELIRDLYNAEFGLSQEDPQWKKKVEESVKLKKGNYEIGLPLKDDDVRLPSSRDMALRKLCSLERKLKRDTKFTEQVRFTEVKRKAVCTATLNRKEEVSPTDKLIRYFSRLHRLKKAVAWVLRVKTMLQDRRRKRLRGPQQDAEKKMRSRSCVC